MLSYLFVSHVLTIIVYVITYPESDVSPGSIWLQPLKSICRLLPPVSNNLSESEISWYHCAVPHVAGRICKIHLRPGDRFDVDKGPVSYTVKLRPQNRVEVTSSIPDNHTENGMLQERRQEIHQSPYMENKIVVEEEIPGNSFDVPQSFITSGHPQSPTIPSHNTLASVEETPHIATRFHQDILATPDSGPNFSPSHAFHGSIASPTNRQGASLDDANSDIPKPSEDAIFHKGSGDPNTTADFSTNPLQDHGDANDDETASEDEVPSTKRQEPLGKDSVGTAIGINEENWRTPSGKQNSQPRAPADGTQRGKNESGRVPEGDGLSDSKDLPKPESFTTAQTPSHDMDQPRKRKFASAVKSPSVPSAKRVKPDQDESQDTDSSVIDFRSTPDLASQRSNSRNPPNESNDGGSKSTQVSAVGDIEFRKSKFVSGASSRRRKTYSKRSKRTIQDQSHLEAPSSTSTARSIIVKGESPRGRRRQDESRQPLSMDSTPVSTSHSNDSNSSAGPSPYGSTSPKVVFSSNSKFAENSKFKHFLRKQGSSIGQHVTDKSDVLCIGHGEIRKSVSLLLAVAYGKHIVTDMWASTSLKAGHLLDLAAFLPTDAFREKEWNFKISDISGRPRDDLFTDKTVYFTPTLKKEYGSSGFKDIEEIIRVCGARNVISRAAKDLPEDSALIILVSTSKDADATLLQREGRQCFNKDILSMSILRGSLDLGSEEFRVGPGRRDQGRPRKKKSVE